MVRLGALDMVEAAPPNQLWPLASPLLTEAVAGVRMRAATVLAAVPTVGLPPSDRERFERAAAEYVAAQRLNADRPEARSAPDRLVRMPTAEAASVMDCRGHSAS